MVSSSQGGKYIYYVAFHLPDGSLSSPRSNGQTSKGAAERWAIQQDRLPLLVELIDSPKTLKFVLAG